MSKPTFSFEVLPPLKGSGTEALFHTIDLLKEFGPRYINITTHRSEYVYHPLENGLMQRQQVRRRPGTIAIAAAIKHKYAIPVVPHIVCGGHCREQLEYMLIDLQLLGISELLVLRGDKAREDASFRPTGDGPSHATELIEQICRFNEGFFADGTQMRTKGHPFRFGVACYPEKHEEAPCMEADIEVLRRKQEMGAQYAVTQLFFDNQKYFDFVERARQAGVSIPIIPGLKPLSRLAHMSVLPKIFRCDIPLPLFTEFQRCTTDEQAAALGVEWAVAQCQELIARGVPGVHFYTMGASESVARIARRVF